MTNEEWVTELYRAILNRQPDGEGYNYWVNALNVGIHTQPSLYQIILQSPEGRASIRKRVREQYVQALGREPENEEVITFWTNEVMAGRVGSDPTQIATKLRSTPEGINYRDRIRNTPVGGGAGTPTSGAGTTTTAASRDLSYEIKSVLDRYDLGELSDFLQQKWVAGDSMDKIMIELYDQPAFRTRFAGIEQRRLAGYAPMSPEEYITYEREAHQLFRAAGLPAQFYDSREDFTNFIAQDVSTAELSARIQQGYQRALTAPIEVRAKYAEWFGINGDIALAANFLDPDKALPLLEQELMAAEVGGFGSIFGVNVSQRTSGQLASMGFDGRSSISGFRQVQEMDPLFFESISETEDFTAEGEGVGSAFGIDNDAAKNLARRAQSRRAALSGGGGLMIGEAGIAGRAE